ncbi:MAG: TonB-dependent receptor plug domain-containing protein, partial [Paludibacteraceae bacterium]|nr:TonB-dependent receptor plug domain-containing protein [Paludibacteraceae bacterium]
MCLALSVAAFSQTIVSGVITDSKTGEPLIGATVLEEGTQNGTITDFDGKFTMNTKSGASVVISSVGYKSQTLKGGSSMNIVLEEDTQDLEELVVTGYTTQRKADLTGAVSVLDMKEPISEGSANVLNSMEGRLPGVQIISDASPGGSGSTIRIRGMSTVNGNEPLYVIDGVATNENLSSLSPSDIESIQVLKDASSASIYGSRAANGVIIITTKRAQDEKVSVNIGYSAT